MLSKRKLARKARLEQQLDEQFQLIFEATEHLIKLRDRFFSFGIVLTDPIVTNNIEYRGYVSEIGKAGLKMTNLLEALRAL